MKKLFKAMAFVAAIGMVCMTGCTKDDLTNDNNANGGSNGGSNDGSGDESALVDYFVGNYSLTVVTDSLGVDGTWFETSYYTEMTGKEEPPRYGRLTISKIDNQTVKLYGKVQIGNDSVVYYDTEAQVNSDGQLVLAPCTTAIGDTPQNFTFSDIDRAQPLAFRSERHLQMYGMDCGYILTNTAERQ